MMRGQLENLLKCVFVLVVIHSAGSTDATKGKMYEVLIYGNIEVRLSNLTCYHCFNGDNTDCMGMSDSRIIPTRTCLVNEPYCKVRRFSIDGKLTTFDRYCASKCEPGCREGGLYAECVSCCNGHSLCNVDNLAISALQPTALTRVEVGIVLFLLQCFNIFVNRVLR